MKIKSIPPVCVNIEDSLDTYKLRCSQELFELFFEKIIQVISEIRTDPCDLCEDIFYDFSAALNKEKNQIVISFICSCGAYESIISLTDEDISKLKSYCKKNI